MNPIIEKKIKELNPINQDDYKNALKEILQNIVLVTLAENGFFDNAAFYGGTALRIFYGLDRFSEDLDFTLCMYGKNFSFQKYFECIKNNSKKYGFEIEIGEKSKSDVFDNINSAFLKANAKICFLSCGAPDAVCNSLNPETKLKVKFEADFEPPLGFNTENMELDFLEKCKIRVLDLPSLLAGKIHAILYREYKNRVKGRDYYDFIFLVKKGVGVNIDYLKNKMQRSQPNIDLSKITIDSIKTMLIDKIRKIDLKKANEDVEPFVHYFNDDRILKLDELLECVSKLSAA